MHYISDVNINRRFIDPSQLITHLKVIFCVGYILNPRYNININSSYNIYSKPLNGEVKKG